MYTGLFFSLMSLQIHLNVINDNDYDNEWLKCVCRVLLLHVYHYVNAHTITYTRIKNKPELPYALSRGQYIVCHWLWFVQICIHRHEHAHTRHTNKHKHINVNSNSNSNESTVNRCVAIAYNAAKWLWCIAIKHRLDNFFE